MKTEINKIPGNICKKKISFWKVSKSKFSLCSENIFPLYVPFYLEYPLFLAFYSSKAVYVRFFNS